MKWLLSVTVIVTLLSVLVFARCGNTPHESIDISSLSKVTISEYWKGDIHYLVFAYPVVGGVAVRNYTQDSLEYEYMKYEPIPGAFNHSNPIDNSWTILPKTK